MDELNRWLCILNVKNKQEDYAKASFLLERLMCIEKARTVTSATFPMEFQIARRDSEELDATKLASLEQTLEEPASGKVSKITSWQQLLSGLEKTSGHNEFSYYIRVDMKEDTSSNLADLSYLVLLLQSHPSVWKYGAVYLQNSGELSAGKKREQYFRFSNFLRLIQQKYRCFYYTYDQALQPLTTRDYGVQTTFVPLVEVDRETYGALCRLGSVQLQYQDQSFSKLYRAFRFSSTRPDQSGEILTQIGLRALFNNLNGHKYNTSDKKKKLLSLLADLMNSVGGITPLNILLFGILFDGHADTALDPEELQNYLVNIQSFSAAIAQLLENIVFHSALAKGTFTCRLHKEYRRIQESHPGYAISRDDYGLEVLIADSNTQDSILEHFLEEGKATANLRAHRNELTLADFFQGEPVGPAAHLWREARISRPEICHGLRSFARMVTDFNGAFYVRSGTSFFGIDDKNSYAIDQEKCNRLYWMPGTQFSTVFRRTKFQKHKQTSPTVFDSAHIIYNTTYRDLALSLQFEQAIGPLFDHGSVELLSKSFAEQRNFMPGQAAKDAMVNCWRDWFDQRIKEYISQKKKENEQTKRKYILLSAEMQNFQGAEETFPGELEVFCKGFFSSGLFRWRDDQLRFVVLFYNISAPLSHAFYQALGAMYQYIDTSKTEVYFYQQTEEDQANELNGAPCLASSMQEILHQIFPSFPEQHEDFPKTLPYLLLTQTENQRSLFEQAMIKQSQASILSQTKQGHKIADTHMRLGNKVHLDAFFEMALFFENPNYAYYTAFLILQRLKTEEKFTQAKKILVYGYASYSRGIVWAFIQIWKCYLALDKEPSQVPEMEFVIYQNDLKLESDQSDAQMYYSRESWQRDASCIWSPEETYLIQIVPISSSLTTFNKMLSEFCLSTGKDFKPQANLTAFWVRDDFIAKSKAGGSGSEEEPTEDERAFWDRVQLPQQTIFSNMLGIQVQYLTYVKSYWRSPLKCVKCFPDDPLLEIPLVETDATSTVPTQQFYLEKDGSQIEPDSIEAEGENDARVARLRGNLLYGHIHRGHNHFQYYIRTRRYFLQERLHIERWLEKLKKNCEKDKQKCVDILVVPKVTSNVEFAQIVYESYFKGEAENIIVNTEKEFRSNFLAEYSGLARRLRRERKLGRKLRFHYIDMSIDSGVAFRRASDLIQSLLNSPGVGEEHITDFQFSNIFLMFNRMSTDSQRSYVRDPECHFHAYVNLYISNMRSFGDSCIPCKLRKEAERYYRNAALKSTSAFWQEKYYSYGSEPFDSSRLHKSDRRAVFGDAYYKMACAHKASYHIATARGGDMKGYFAAMRSFFAEIQDAFHNRRSATSPIYEKLKDGTEDAYTWFSAAIKVLARPFFVFDYRLRCAVLDLYLLLTEHFLDPEGGNFVQNRFEARKDYLTQDNLMWVKSLADDIELALGAKQDTQERSTHRIRLIQHVLLKGLADLKSNYIMRGETMIRVFQAVCSVNLRSNERKDFLERYRRSILRLVHNSSDETKSLWLEYLLQFHKEYPQGANPMELDERRIPPEVGQDFQEFLDLLLVENNRPLLQGVQNLCRIPNEGVESERDGLRRYNMRNVCQFISFGYEEVDSSDEGLEEVIRARLMPSVELYRLLMASKMPDRNLVQGINPLRRYNQLQKALEDIVRPKKNSKEILEKVLLLGPQQQTEQWQQRRPQYYLISPQPPIDYKGQTRYERALRTLENPIKEHNEELTTYGFALLETGNSYDVMLLLDNNFDELIKLLDINEYHGQKIDPMYIYLPCHTDKKHALMLTREILMFRCSLVAWLEQDFNNNAISALARQRYWAETLAADKVGDHNEQDFIECVRRVLSEDSSNQDDCSLYEANGSLRGACEVVRVLANGKEKNIIIKLKDSILDELRQWHLLCSYVNSRIARLYRTFVQEVSHEGYALTKEYVLDQIKEYYARNYKAIGRECADSISDVFFRLIEAESSRKDYLRQILKMVTFTLVDGEKREEDTAFGRDIEDRLAFLKARFKNFRCIGFSKEGVKYGYLAEYLAVIFLDCCISALKVSETWQRNRSGYETFLALFDCDVEEKCRIILRRLPCNDEVDYLVIENEIHLTDHEVTKDGPGMSQAAIRWYVDKLWKFNSGNLYGESSGEISAYVPRVETRSQENKYQILLPILKKEGMS